MKSSFYSKLWLEQARTNTEAYDDAFAVVPTDRVKTMEECTKVGEHIDIISPVTGSSILLYSSRVCPNSEILLLSPLEDENHAKPTLFPQFPGKEAINFQRYLASFRFLAIIFNLELIC